LYGLSAGGQKGVEDVLKKIKAEIKRDMTLMGCRNLKELNRSKIIYR
jgi:L-lactate dehydrogenase (cytochrome)